MAPTPWDFTGKWFLARMAVHMRLEGAWSCKALVTHLALVLLLGIGRHFGGKLTHHRLRWRNVGPDQLRWSWESARSRHRVVAGVRGGGAVICGRIGRRHRAAIIWEASARFCGDGGVAGQRSWETIRIGGTTLGSNVIDVSGGQVRHILVTESEHAT